MGDVSRFLAEVLEVSSYAPFQFAKVRRREESSSVGRPHYPVVGGRVVVGEWVWCLETEGSLVILGREFIPSTHVEGLKLEWVSGTSLKVSAGSCYVPALQGVIEALNPIAKSGLVLTANTWYYVYAFAGAGGALDIEVMSTAPSAPYRGSARTKTGDDTRRFLGSVRAGGGATLLRFERVGELVRWKENQNTTCEVVSNATNVNSVETSTAGLQPPTSRCVLAYGQLRWTSPTDGILHLAGTDDGLQTVGSAATLGQLSTPQANTNNRRPSVMGPLVTGAAPQAIRHGHTGDATLDHNVSVLGYYEER